MANQDPPNASVEEKIGSEESTPPSQKQAADLAGKADNPEDASDSLSKFTVNETEPLSESDDKKEAAKTTEVAPRQAEPIVRNDLQKPSILAIVVGKTWIPIFLILIISLIALSRYSGIFPLFSNPAKSPPLVSPPPAIEFTRNYVLVGMYDKKLYFYDQQTNIVFEATYDEKTGLGQPVSRGKQDLIFAIDKIIPSPEKTKAALLTTRTKYDNAIYVLDFAKFGEVDKFITKWPPEMPSGYQLHTQATAAWSPNETSLAFVASKENQPDLFIVNVDNQVQRVTYQGKNIGSITWIDNDHLAFVSDWEGQDQMYTIHRNGGDLKKIAR